MTSPWFSKNETGAYQYKLLRSVSFIVPSLNLPSGIQFYSTSGWLVASSQDGKLTLFERYHWDGCTGIGKIIETQQTLIASLLHDFLYQLSEQSSWTPPFTQRQADIAFRRLLPCWAKPLYYLGVRAAGWAFWGDKQDTLVIKNK